MDRKEIKDKFNVLSCKYYNNLASEIRGILFNIKNTWNWTNEDLAFMLDISENRLEYILSEDWDGKISSRVIARINILSLGKLSVPNCRLVDLDIKDGRNIIASYQATKMPVKTRDEKIQDVLDLFGVTDDSSLDRLLDAIINVRATIDDVTSKLNISEEDTTCDCDCKKEDTCEEKTMCDCEEKCTCGCECSESKPILKISGSKYDSSTMDKPETFNLKFDGMNLDKLTDDMYKDLCNFFNFDSNQISK